jgi:hypothetical protein
MFAGGGDLPDFDALVVDETFWSAAVPDKPTTVSLDALRHLPTVPNGRGGDDLELTNDLDMHRKALVQALTANGAGPLRRSVLAAHGVTVEMASQGRALEYERAERAARWLKPGQTSEQRKTVADKIRGYGHPTRDATIWGASVRCPCS